MQKISFYTLFLVALLLTLTSLAIAQTANPIWSKETVESKGYDPSLAVDSAGNPQVSFTDALSNQLKYAVWNGSGWTMQIVDENGEGSAISLASDGTPKIFYCSRSPLNFGLLYAVLNSSTWNIQNVDAFGSSMRSSFVLDSNLNPHVSYNDDDKNVRYANWNGSAWTIQTVDSSSGPPSLALDLQGNPHISYCSDKPPYDLKYASWNGTGWDIQIVDLCQYYVDSDLALDSSGNPHLCYPYYDANPYTSNTTVSLRYTSWNGLDWSKQTVDIFNVPCVAVSLVLDSKDNPHAAYSVGYNVQDAAVKYAYWNGSWSTQTIATSILGSLSLKLDSKQNPAISYGGQDSNVPGNQGVYYASFASSPAQANFLQTNILVAGVIATVIIIVAGVIVYRSRRAKN
jgi:hypothetical protein